MKLVTRGMERAYYAVTDPVTERLVRLGVTPNLITTVGATLVVLSAVGFALGAVRLGGALLLLSGVVDTFDGAVARSSGKVSRFGAFYDSTLDRVGDGATFIGIAIYFLRAPDVAYRIESVLLCMVAILSSLLVSYARARAEGLGLECKVGLVQRAERLLGIGVPSLLVGAGPGAVVLQAITALLAVLSTVTVIQRFVYVYRVTRADG
ncbi:MAG TPA: CDP-alcohol phosphatidyltransferase family protein [Gemmatimonadales bacterium]|nr:CDP-alcohol phosphatidyltransferase family protein [Gemmatimonadales bacterium]